VTRRRRPATPRGLCSDCGARFEHFARRGPGNVWRFCDECYRGFLAQRKLDDKWLDAVARDSRGEAA
jgi:hypothetical protein